MSTTALFLATLLFPGAAGEAGTGPSPSSAGARPSLADTAPAAKAAPETRVSPAATAVPVARTSPAATAAAAPAVGSRPIPVSVRPFRPDSSARNRAGGTSPRTLLPAAVAGLAAISGWDEPARRGALDLRGEGTGADEAVFDAAELFGAWEVALPAYVTGAVGAGALIGGSEGARRGLAALAGTAAASAANEALNRAVGRARPSWEEGAFSFDAFRGHASFPSGHTAFVFAAAAGLDAVTEGWIPAAAGYGVASLTGVSRVYHDRHWLTDVVAGAALGTAVSHVVARRMFGALGVAEEEGDGEGAAGSGTPRIRPLADPATGTLGLLLTL